MKVYGIAKRHKNNRGFEYIYITPGIRKRALQPYLGEVVVKLDVEVVEDGRKQKRKMAKRGKKGGGGSGC
jgi:hypothetical protein